MAPASAPFTVNSTSFSGFLVKMAFTSTFAAGIFIVRVCVISTVVRPPS